MRGLWRDRRGATLIEFAVVLPLVLAVTFGLMEAGLVVWAKVGLQHGVEVAARCASVSDTALKFAASSLPDVNPTPCYSSKANASANVAAVQAYAAKNAWGLGPPDSTFSVTRSDPGCQFTDSGGVLHPGNLVTASYAFSAITYFLTPTLTARACYPTV